MIVDVIDSDNSEKKLTKKEYEELIEYIEKFYPDFFKSEDKNWNIKMCNYKEQDGLLTLLINLFKSLFFKK